MIAVLVILVCFAAAGITAPIAGIGKIPKTLQSDVAAAAVMLLVTALAGLVYVMAYLHGGVPADAVAAFIAMSWFVRLVSIPLRVDKVYTAPGTAGPAVINTVWNLAVLAGLLYLLSQV